MLDYPNDPNLSLVARVLTLANAPDYVRQSPLAQLGETGKTASFYADPTNRRLPVGTKAACYLSRAYFEVQRGSLTQSRQKAIDSRLSQMEQQYKIAEDTRRIREVIEDEERNRPEAMDASIRSKLAAGKIVAGPDALITIARCLLESSDKLASSPHSFANKWAFTQQFENFGSQVRSLWVKYPHCKEALFAVAKEIDELSPRQQVEQLPEIAKKLARFEPSAIKLHQLLYNMPPATASKLKIAGCIFKESEVAGRLCDLNKIAASPLIHQVLRTPVDNWQNKIEALPASEQAKLSEHLLAASGR